MTPEVREQVRIALLRYLAANKTRWGYNVALLRQLLVADGFGYLSPAEVEAELQYLADKGLVAEAPKLISPELRAWRITAAGRDWLATTGQEGTL